MNLGQISIHIGRSPPAQKGMSCGIPEWVYHIGRSPPARMGMDCGMPEWVRKAGHADWGNESSNTL